MKHLASLEKSDFSLNPVRLLHKARKHAGALRRYLTQRTDVDYIFFKSMPRSGHGFVSLFLVRYFGQKLVYCEFYKAQDCCHRLPCIKPRNAERSNLYFAQKSHDFLLNDPKFFRGKYIIQFRSPVPRLQSNYELYKRVMPEPDTKDTFVEFAKRETNYFIRFYEKWIKHPRHNDLILAYDDLIEKPEENLLRLVDFIGGKEQTNPELVRTVLAQAPIRGASPPEGAKGLRDPYAYPYFDEELYASLERRIAEACGDDCVRFRFLREAV